MSIKTIETVVRDDRTICKVEITEPGHDADYAWEFWCEACEELCTGLHEVEAYAELDNHTCVLAEDIDQSEAPNAG